MKIVSSSHANFVSFLVLAEKVKKEMVLLLIVLHIAQSIAICFHYGIVSKPKIMNISLGLWRFYYFLLFR